MDGYNIETDRTERMLQRMEKKLRLIPAAGKKLACIPLMISMLRGYIRGEYREAPAGTIIALLAALVYAVVPLDLMPDALPGIGIADDAAVIAVCLRLTGSDLREYAQWRISSGRTI